MHSGQGLPNRRARRSSAQDARRGDRPCAIAHCSNTCKRALPNCQHVVCTHCVFNMMGACPGDAGPCLGFKCPICRRRYDTDASHVKRLMATLAPGHCKDMPCCCPIDCGKVYAIKHSACSRGCYDCEESQLHLALVSIHGNDTASDSGSESESSGRESSQIPEGTTPQDAQSTTPPATPIAAPVHLNELD